MSFRTILTVTGPGLGDSDLKLAAALCGEVEGHLSVILVGVAAPPPVGEYATVISEGWLNERQADQDRLRQRADAVSALLAASPVSSDLSSVYSEEAWADETIGRRARYADLTIAGPELLRQDLLKYKTFEGALFHSGKPLLLLPEGSAATLKPKRILVAWDARIEAFRALAQSLDLLAAAENVHLVLVDPVESEDRHGEEPGADVATYLARHGVKVTVDRLPDQGRSVQSVLRQHAIDMAADLLVMGAYGHSRLRQRIFGGVTRSMLEEPPLAVFLAR